MRFVKMHGLGNDYVYVDCIRGPEPADPASLAISVARPHFGVGSDGLILIGPSDTADARMRIFNADGSEGAMCGNGIRCVGKYLYDTGLCRKENLLIETKAGLRTLQMVIENGVATGARVDMGAPVFEPKLVPVRADARPAVDIPLFAAGVRFLFTCLSFGNAHAVTFGPLPDDRLFEEAGPALENNEAFPERANIEFCHVADRHSLEVRVWERGSGATMACGTGATASAVAAIVKGLCDSPVTVRFAEGELRIDWAGGGESAFMTGPATKVFEGDWPD